MQLAWRFMAFARMNALQLLSAVSQFACSYTTR